MTMPAIRVAVIQSDPVFGAVQENMDAALAAIPADCDLAVLPELFATGYQFVDRQEAWQWAEDPADGPISARLRAHAAEHDTVLVAGLAERAGDQLFNSALLIRPDGSWETYRKVHLFWNEKDIFAPGDLGFPVFEACGTTIGLMICFDWVFPEAARSLALRGAKLLCHPSNLLLPYCYDAMITRCVENRVFAATSNRVGTEHRTAEAVTFNGLSQIVSPGGERLDSCAGTGTGMAASTIDPDDTSKRLTPRNDLWEDRRPDAYAL